MSNLTFPIRAASKLTGLSVDTLRAWERRYQAISPDRSGHIRRYNEADIARLTLLREAVEGGHSISQLAPLPNPQIEALLGRHVALQATPKQPTNVAAPNALRPDLQMLLLAIDQFDNAGIDRELNRLATLVSPRDLLQEILAPLMEQIGEHWHQGNLTIAQGNMVYSAIRNLLGTLIRLNTRQQTATTVLFATLSGELHEFGILSAAILAVRGGLDIAYLGIDLSVEEIMDAAAKTSAQVVVLGFKGAVNPQASLKLLRRIAQQLPATMELWVGGASTKEIVREINATRAIYIQDFHFLEQHLIRVGAQF